MGTQTALKIDSKKEGKGFVEADPGASAPPISEQAYDDDLHRRFMDWKDQSEKSLQVIAKMLNRSTAAISQYINRKFVGKLELMEKDVANLLQREEDLQYVVILDQFRNTEPARLMFEVLEYCDKKGKMGVILAPSGTGKTETCKEYKRLNRSTVFVTADVSTRRIGATVALLASHIGGTAHRSISETLHYIIGRMKDSKRLIIIDDAHFLTWEAYEAVRKIHDCAGVGVVYVGQERLYEQMRGAENKAYLFDQIYSRIAIKRDKFTISKKDAKVIATGMCPSLDPDCIDFLFNKAKQKGRFRLMTNLLDVAMESQKTMNVPMSVELLQEASKFLKIE